MRVFRTILGMLLLTIGLPALLAGGGLWAVMQHRDPGGAFTGELQRLTVPGYAVVVPDIDRLLRDDAPFARMSGTEVRLSAVTADGPAFLGIAPSGAVARYLAGVPYHRVDAVGLGTGVLPVTTVRSAGRREPDGEPARQPFWTARGFGQLAFTPADLGGHPQSLVLMNPGGAPVARLASVAEIRPGRLDAATWALLTLGTLLVMAGVIVLTWPGRRREVVYVVEPSQVPELMHAIGAPLPLPGGLAYHSGPRGGAHRPRTLADLRSSRPPALPQFAWPPNRPAGPFPPTFTAPADEPEPASGSLLTDDPDSPAPVPGDRTPAPGQPLSLLGDTPAPAGSQPGTVPARRGDRRRSPSGPDGPEFQATAVGAWVAATAPERARKTEARAAARMAEVARNAGKFTPAAPGKTNMPGATIPIAPRRGEPASTTDTPDVTEEPAGRTPDAADEHADGADRPTTPPKTPTQRPETAANPDPVRPDGAPATADEPAPGPAVTGEPRATTARVALRTGPAATDWTATGLTRLEPRRAPEPGPETAPVTGEAADRPAQTGAVASDEPAADLTVKPGTHDSVPPADLTVKPGTHDSVPPVTEPEPTTTDEEESGKRPIIPFPTRPAPDSSPGDDRGEPAPAGGEQRASIHAVEAGIPALEQATAPETVTNDGEAGRPEPEQPPTRPGRSKRASMHAVEAGGLTLGKKPAPVPTQGLATPLRPASESPASESPASENAASGSEGPASGSVASESPTFESAASGSAASESAAAESVTEPAAEKAADASSGPVKSTAKASGTAKAGSGATRETAEGTKTPRARSDRARATESGEDNPLARARNRTTGTKPATPRPAPAARRTPASWVRAAESVEARTGAQAPDGTAQPVPPKSRTAETPTAGDPKPKAAGNRPLSYREEAAELLAGGSDQRRRRSTAGRARAKDGDEKS
ncbi:hypothetical protein [Actinoplanes flavus]|uniref:Uncharacterized protein n=1 Tax=Actinoplanes flavus TaxID=2820290 RepID=A0ABS3ULR7_9ACTN|nr:hypothetical protein [Actinoplanes flavus]MBO3739709.1 hypothetical protein [Actinoplanes flavus]